MILTSMPLICLPAYAKQFGPSYYRGPNYEVWTFANGMRQWVSATQAVWNGSHWVDYIFQDLYDAQGKYVIQTGLIAVEIFDYYAKFYDPNMTEVRLYDERWEIQQWKSVGQGSWSNIGAQSGKPVFKVSTFKNGVNITKSFHSWAGWLNITYTFSEHLKHTVTWQSEMGTPQTFRVLQKWAGIVGAKCKHEQGSTNILSTTQINGSYFEFLKLNYDLSVLENQWSARQYLQPVIIDLHAQGMKCDFIFANWTLSDRQSLTIDPTTTTFYSLGDSFVSEWLPTTNFGTSSTLTLNDRIDFNSRFYIDFDVSSIPSGSTVSFANVSLYHYSHHDYGVAPSSTIDLHATSIFEETEITWNNAPSLGLNLANVTVPPAESYGWVNWTSSDLISNIEEYAGGHAYYGFKFDVETGLYDASRTRSFWSREKTDYKPFLNVTYTPAPTIGEFQAPTIAYSDTKFSLACTVNHNYGVSYLDYVTMEISASVILKWDNTTDTFSEYSDINNLCILFADESAKTVVNGTAYTLTWKIMLSANFPKGSVHVVETNTKAFDSYGQHGSGSQSSLFLFKSKTIVGSGDIIEDKKDEGFLGLPPTKIEIPPWGYWVIGGTIAVVGIGALMQSGKKKRRVREVRTQPKTHKPKKTKRDSRGRYK